MIADAHAPAGGDPTLPQVFVSYAHDTTEHEDDVRFLARLLVAAGIDVVLDQWVHERQDWQAWATRAILTTDHTIAVASPRYAAAASGTAHADRVLAETTILRDLLHQSPREWTAKILPVVLPTHSPADLPRFLMPALTGHYAVTELSSPGIEDLVRVITKQRRRVKPAPGDVPPLPPEPEPAQHRSAPPQDIKRYAAEISPLCLAIRANLVKVDQDIEVPPLRTKAGRKANALQMRRYHEVLDAGWWKLSSVRLPTSEEDRRRIRQWQEIYLRLLAAYGMTAMWMERWASRPAALGLIPPVTASVAGVHTLKLHREFTHQSKLLGIIDPTGG
ncbi:toll/interleukin-1 receptor domain-containing protein [Actinokineospora diospyrosa]|uniref:SEFIR domain-containing protein n=1 Tax=Actinokineospora diospyrosa TaxID=103728 RepID=A0ABT1IF03_9PSEU|nr:toll/interleukin-1 receptor domain-containing protein [Actinokineospora diospyrosa]MCP2271185.1 SEFIR domain-containing protein [Actinokineospora diospyrosa]